jgi:ferric-dicitrate binding protein FerR (iron transport regulator)
LSVYKEMNLNGNIEEHLLLQYLLGRMPEEERRGIDDWLNESEINRRHLDRLEAVWAETGKLTPHPVAVDVSMAWQRLSARIEQYEEEQKPVTVTGIIRMPMVRWISGIAATIVIALGIWWLADRLTQPPAMVTLTATSEVLKDSLPDGSLIALNKNTTLTYPEKFGDKKRTVTLSGEAFFNVRPTGKPFVVEAGTGTIRVLGTAFNVRSYPGETIEVSVNTGRVIFFGIDPQSGDTSWVILTEGMKGLLKPGSHTPEIVDVSSPDDQFWMNCRLDFRQTSLNEVFEALARYFGVTIRVENPQILACRLTAIFEDDPAGVILEVIAESFDLTLATENNIYIFSGNGCSGQGN